MLFIYAANVLGDRRAVQFVEEAMHLFATEYGMDADLDMENFTALSIFCERYAFKSEPSALAKVSVANIPFAHRFAIAVGSARWHPDFFAAAFHEEEWTMLATRTDEAGKTALHWAASHYREFTRFSGDVDHSDISSGYANIAIKLVRNGADVHACWGRLEGRSIDVYSCWDETSTRGTIWKVSPLLSFLQGLSPYMYWTAAALSDAVYRWGQVLVEAGISLPSYAAGENLFLQATRDAIHVLDGRDFLVAGLEVSAQGRLTMRVELTFEVPIWKARPTHVPGEWPVSPSLPGQVTCLPEAPDTITWSPEEQDEREGFRWVSTGSSIKTRTYLVEPPGTAGNHGLKPVVDTVNPGGYVEYHRAIEDDDFYVVTMKKDEEFRQRAQAYARRRRRSASAPVFEKRLGRSFLYLPGPWCGTTHRCSLDLRWKMSGISEPSLRDCLQGRCREVTDVPTYRSKLIETGWSYTWEAQLLQNERYAQVAKRFAQRFCPQHLNIAETTLARVTERARLAMGPVRPPARSW